ncbi:hypothetical protein WN943_004065 [Citrus x changshan-huyou]
MVVCTVDVVNTVSLAFAVPAYYRIHLGLQTTLYSIENGGNGENGGNREAELNDSAVENCSQRARSPIHGQASGESNTQLSDDGDDYQEYGVNIMNFDTTKKDIKELRKEYHIPDGIMLRLLGEDEMASKLGHRETAIYMEMFRLSFRLPIQPYFARMLVRLGLSPGQLDLNGWRILGSMHIVWAEQNKDLDARNDENAQLAEDLVIEKRSNANKSLKGQGKIEELERALSKAKLNNEKMANDHEFEKVKLEVDQRIRSEKKLLKADVIQTCIELFQEKHLDMDFQWMLTAYVSKEKARKKSLGTSQEEIHNQVLEGGEVGIKGETSLTNRVVEG